MMEAIPIYIGYDSREAAAYHVCCQSIIEHASGPVAFIPLALRLLRGYSEEHTDGSNAFIYSRFLVPWLERWGHSHKHAIYLDGDMLLRGDIYDLWALREHDVGVQVVQHDYKTTAAKKYLGAANEDYPRKNWSSVMLWNCAFMENRKLTPELVARATGSFLHRFQWLSDARIGALPPEWNHLVGEYPRSDAARLLHHTLGSPCFGGQYAEAEGADEWQRVLRNVLAPMGGPAAIG